MQAGKKQISGRDGHERRVFRSHAIFTIIVECDSTGVRQGDHITVGKLNLVDLAGSERSQNTSYR